VLDQAFSATPPPKKVLELQKKLDQAWNQVKPEAVNAVVSC